MDQPPQSRLRRRPLLGAGVVGGLAIASGLVVRNQIRHPHKEKARPDGKQRRLVLAAPGFAHDPVLLAARDQGLFARYNLDIEYGPGVVSGQDALDQVQAGRADAALVAALSWLPRLQAGPRQQLDAQLVCGLQIGSARLLIPRHSPVHRIEDLHRRAIGVTHPDGPDRLFFSIMMRRKGMNPDRDVEWRTLPADGLGLALAEGQVQAIVGHDPAIWKLRQSLHLDELASSMSGSYGARANRMLGLRVALLRDDPKAALALAMAMQDAAVWSAAHMPQVGTLVAAADPDLTVEQAVRMLKAEGHDVHLVGVNLRNQVAQYVDELKLLGLTPEDVDSAAFAKRVTANVLKA